MDAAERERLQQSMVALARGDRSAFRPVFDGLWPLLLRFCRRSLGEAPLAEDAAQGALMKLLFHASEFQPDGDVVAWALGVAAFECRSLRNRRTRRAEAPAGQELAAVALNHPSPEAAVIDADLGAALREVMHGLRPLDRETLLQALGHASPTASTPAFRKRLQRALERLRQAWRHTHGSDH
ncbi:MAG TPA: sigma-70 family RNA polymerase sigma factor [Myxococcaceae bacterium]|nr:sigma-70 family RNA polymerase sigma factor [Myxococcaceae bacterium]